MWNDQVQLSMNLGVECAHKSSFIAYCGHGFQQYHVYYFIKVYFHCSYFNASMGALIVPWYNNFGKKVLIICRIEYLSGTQWAYHVNWYAVKCILEYKVMTSSPYGITLKL